MTGTSLDAIDVVISQAPAFNEVVAAKQVPLSKSLKQALANLSSIEYVAQSLASIKNIEQDYTSETILAVAQVLNDAQLASPDIKAIGVHGVTVCHLPNEEKGFTWQIIDAHRLAAEAGIDVIYDFRSKDVGLGGQGAPLVPPFHYHLFKGLGEQVAVLNLGGIANVTTWQGGELLGFDTGPANTLLDAWYSLHIASEFDVDGNWAQSGRCLPELLDKLLSAPYFKKPYPKSTGKEEFNLAWLEQALSELQIDPTKNPTEAVNVQCTLAHLTAKSVAESITAIGEFETLVVCGGGVHNQFLMSLLAHYLPQVDVQSSLKFSVCPDSLEALAFAWLAYCRCLQIQSSAPSVTGAKRAAVLGAWVTAH